MIQAYKNFFKGFLDFSGRSTRSDFWWVWLINNIFCIPLYIIYFEMILNTGKEIDPISGVAFLSLYIILFMVLFIPSLALKVRRLRDAGLHWAFIFFELIPLLGYLQWFYLSSCAFAGWCYPFNLVSFSYKGIRCTNN